MAYTLIDDARANQYVGLSSDTKPTSSNVVAGATFVERDTGLTYIYDGTAWGVIATGGGVGADTATLSNVNDTASSTTLLAANTSRLGVVIFNDSSSDLYLKYGTTASTSSFTYKIPPLGHWEMPSGMIYTGIIHGIWSADASGAARVTELT